MPIGLLLPPASRHSRPTTALPLQSDKADVRVDLHDRSAQKVLMMALRSNDASSSLHSLPDGESNGVGGGDRRRRRRLWAAAARRRRLRLATAGWRFRGRGGGWYAGGGGAWK